METKTRIKLKFEDALSLNELDFEEYIKYMKRMELNLEENENPQYEEYTDFNLLRERQEIYWQFGLLCIELKHLYVCITWPK